MTDHADSPGAAPTKELLEAWIQAFRGPLVGMLASWGSDWHTAHELAQDTFAEAWVSRERFTGAVDDLEAGGAWLRGIAFNLHRSALRRAASRAMLSLEDRDQDPTQVEEEFDERRSALAGAFAELSAAHQNVLRMHYLEETSARQVAALLGLSCKAVESRLYQARRALRGKIEKMEQEKKHEVMR